MRSQQADGNGPVVETQPARPSTSPVPDVVAGVEERPDPINRPIEVAEGVLSRPDSVSRPAEAPAFAAQKFDEVLCVVTIDGEAKELDAVLLFGGTNLVVTDEDEKVLYTLPYRRVQKATYWKTQRRFVRTTRHWLTSGVGAEDAKRTGVTVTRRPG